MDIHKIARDRLMSSPALKQPLKQGQILEGKILKIYPNNKAQIRLGSQTMIAQLELALTVGEQFHFQVKSAGEVIHLKVIGEHLKSESQINAEQLIGNLGLKPNRENIKFVQELMNQKIPFDKNDLIRVFSLIESTKHKDAAHQVLQEMIRQKMPMTSSVFNALLIRDTSSLSEQIQEVIQQLRQEKLPSNLQQKILQRLTTITELPLANKHQMMLQIMMGASSNDQKMYEILKLTGLIDQKGDFKIWKSQIEQLFSQPLIRMPYLFGEQPTLTIPIQTNDIQQASQQMKNMQSNLHTMSQHLMTTWTNMINELTFDNQQLMREETDALKQFLSERIIPLLVNAKEIISANQLLIIEDNLSTGIRSTDQMSEQINITQQELRSTSQKIIEQWINAMNKTVIRNIPTSGVKQDLIGRIMPFLVTNHAYLSNQSLSQLTEEFPVDVETIEHALHHLKTVETPLRTASQAMIERWSGLINEMITKGSAQFDQYFSQLKRDITESINPLLTSKQIDVMDGQLKNSPDPLQQLLRTLGTYANEQTYRKIDSMLMMVNRQDFFSVIPPQEQFLNQLRETLLLSAPIHESSILQDSIKQDAQTVKSMLLQLIQQGEAGGSERIQQLLHYINGLQLKSVHEIGNFIQASMQIPGEKLGLNKDLFVEFESKKTEDDKIDPDFCRILFYLDLAHLKETIVDMQVQKRLVSITIFNDQDQLKDQSVTLQPMLKQGLESLNYRLLNVMIKPLKEMEYMKRANPKQPQQNTYEGIEFRV